MSNVLHQPPPPVNPDIMATEAEADLTTTKLQLENDSLKRRLAKYATTLEDLTLHAKREISSSARARDEALAAAGESLTLREAMSDMEAALADAHAQRDAAQNAIQETSDQLTEAQEKSDILEKRVQQLSDDLAASNRDNPVRDRDLNTERERDLETKVREFEDVAEVLRTDLRAKDDEVTKSQQQVNELQDAQRLLQQRVVRAEAAVQETEAALRKELDQALKNLGERNTLIDAMKKREKASVEARDAVQERDALRCNVNQLQEELEQSTEMLTRAAIDALGDKGRIRKLEEGLGKTKDHLATTVAEKSDRERKIYALGQSIARLEKELDDERTSKRSLADQCHKYQMHIHQQEKVVASKTRAYEELTSDRNDRAFQVDRVSLELSNAKNALAKKESEFINLSAEYEDVRSQLKTTSKDLEDRSLEASTIRKEFGAAIEEIQDLKQEKERFKATISELQVSRRQLQELSALAAEKDEELSTVKRWYTTLKTEAAESFREKKRLSDMLSDVSGDLKRANQELDILRNMRKDQEVLAARISHLGETSTRELSAMRQTQTEQATALAKNTVDEYTRRLEDMQASSQREIAATVASQLRSDVMPQLMHAVDAKAKHLVQSLARHVESFTLDTETSFQPKASDTITNANDDSINEPHTNVATAYGSGAPSESRSAPTSAFQSASPSAPRSAIPSNFIPSTTDSVSVPDVSRVDSVEGSTAGPSNLSPEPSVEQPRAYQIMSPVESPTGSPIEAQSEDGYIPHEIEAVREIAVPPLVHEGADALEAEPKMEAESIPEMQANPEPIGEPELEAEPEVVAAPEPVEPADAGLEVEMEEDASRDLGVIEEVEATREAMLEPAEEEIYEERGVQYEFDEEGDTAAAAAEVSALSIEEEVAPEAEEVVDIGQEATEAVEAMGFRGAEEVAEPAEEAAEPAEEMAEPVEDVPVAEPVEEVAEVTEPAEDVVEPAEEAAEPVEEAAEPAEEVADPAEEVVEPAEEVVEEEAVGTTEGAVEELDLTEEPAEDMEDIEDMNEDYDGVGGDNVYGEAIIEELDDNDEGYIHGMPPEMTPQDDGEDEEDEQVGVAEFVDATDLGEEMGAAEAGEALGAAVMEDIERAAAEPADEGETGADEPEPVEELLEEHDATEADEGAEDKSDDMGEEAADMGLGDGHVPDIGVDPGDAGEDDERDGRELDY